MHVLGISCFYHDAAACLVSDGRIMAAAEEERFTRRKHDSGFPDHAIRYCLEEAGITAGELDAVVFYEKPLLKFERILESHMATFPRSGRSFVRAMEVWLKDKLWTRSNIRRRLGTTRIAFAEHHMSHAASAFFASEYEEAAILTADGVGEWTTTALGVGQGSDLRLLREIRFPHSLGLMYSAFTRYLGFEVNEGEYKVMGLAAYGKPRYVDRVRRLIDVGGDGSFQLDMRYFEYHRALHLYGRALVDLFGPERSPDSEMDQRHADVAASIQAVLEDAMTRIAQEVRRFTGMTALCMAGGVALNGLANAKIVREAGFRDVFIQPASGDSGGALGAALYLHNRETRTRGPAMRSAYLGPAFHDDEIALVLAAGGVPSVHMDDAELIEVIAERLEKGHVIGWFRGRMEFGPRALGNRSILASPLEHEMKRTLNSKIKHREAFRPFGPSVSAELARDWFELDQASPYMLQIVPVRAERRSRIPAVTHEDGTARVQTVAREDNPMYYDLIRAFERRTGVPLLVNTSLNVRGQPIACTPNDALDCFARTELDAIVLGNHVVGSDARKTLTQRGPVRVSDRREEVIH